MENEIKNINTLQKWLTLKFLEYKTEKYNEATYNWSSGYRRCLRDVLTFINEMDKNSNRSK